MASTREYLDYVLERLSGVEDVRHRAMMGEYILYHRGRVFGGVYDDRLLLKPTPSARAALTDAPMETPYEGGKPMLLADPDDARLVALVPRMYGELSDTKKRKT